jgi:hypothetical protein
MKIRSSGHPQRPRLLGGAEPRLGLGGGVRVLAFALHVRNDNRERSPPLVRLKAVAGPDDQGEPCLTVMLPDEDRPN